MNYSTDFNPRHILCPVDFSDLSILALKYAVTGARLYGSKLTILNSELFEMPRYFSRTDTDRLDNEVANAKKMITKELADHVMKDLGKRAEGVDIQYRITEVNPIDAILQSVEEVANDLIVMGTHGLHGFKRLLLGSTTESVIQSAKVPVFTVRQKQHEFIDVNNADALPHIKRVLCASELNEGDRAIMGYAVSVAERFNARLTVLYSDETNGSMDSEQAKEAFCNWVTGIAKTQCELEPVIRKGSAADQIITQAKEAKSDLIVIGRRQKMFQDSTILGKTTDLVVRHAPAPVLVIPGLPGK